MYVGFLGGLIREHFFQPDIDQLACIVPDARLIQHARFAISNLVHPQLFALAVLCRRGFAIVILRVCPAIA